jgi:hypothetical protein
MWAIGSARMRDSNSIATWSTYQASRHRTGAGLWQASVWFAIHRGNAISSKRHFARGDRSRLPCAGDRLTTGTIRQLVT